MSKPINLILAMTFNGGIGYQNKIPWSIPKEMKKFREITKHVVDNNKQNAVIMGRKTWESISKCLPNRKNIVISSNKYYRNQITDENVLIFPNIDEAMIYCFINSMIEQIFIIGGTTLYNELMHNHTYNVNKIFLSVIFEYKIKTDSYINLDILYKNFYLEKDENYKKEHKERLFASYICYLK